MILVVSMPVKALGTWARVTQLGLQAPQLDTSDFQALCFRMLKAFADGHFSSSFHRNI